MSITNVIFICTIVAIVVAVVVGFVVYSKMRHRVDYMLDALEDKEFNFRFNEQVLIGRDFNKTLNRLRTIFDKERHEISEQERYYGQMLDHVQEQCHKLGFDEVVLAVNKQNSKAIKAYQRNGFTIYDSVCNPIGNGFFMDDYLMKKAITG